MELRTEAGDWVVGACGRAPVETGLITTMGLAKQGGERVRVIPGVGLVMEMFTWQYPLWCWRGIYLWWVWWCLAAPRPVGWN